MHSNNEDLEISFIKIIKKCIQYCYGKLIKMKVTKKSLFIEKITNGSLKFIKQLFAIFISFYPIFIYSF